ncbi:hypothetical protein GVO57_06030 [Sphingomonas changnyeongensis]|uniref:Uncharacterized protein n=1 Tax=Sphingomonas changnyeongensis TaxID=2698679 RepID=A0A7Z2NVA7_9SPHN|nr:hypothetical protein [Sphingomonas changnyeongensis]QHL90473.1 hypothetical protein GVO57_06030 [Sphingomonas changnyeongensis]
MTSSRIVIAAQSWPPHPQTGDMRRFHNWRAAAAMRQAKRDQEAEHFYWLWVQTQSLGPVFDDDLVIKAGGVPQDMS